MSTLNMPQINYRLRVDGMSLECSPALPFDLATYSTRPNNVHGHPVFTTTRPSLLFNTFERENEELQQALTDDSLITELPTVNAGLLGVTEEELRSRGFRVTVEDAPRRPRRFGMSRPNELGEFIAARNRGVIGYRGAGRRDLLLDIVNSMPDASIAIVTLNDEGAMQIAENAKDIFVVRSQKTFTEDQLNSRVVVGTCSSLEQDCIEFYKRDLILIADANLCDHVACERLLFHPDNAARLFVIVNEHESIHPKIQDRVIQFVGLDSFTFIQDGINPANISVKYQLLTSPPPDTGDEINEIRLLSRLETQESRNTAVVHVAQCEASDNTNGMTILVCASPSHAERLAMELTDWMYGISDLRDRSSIPSGLMGRVTQASAMQDQNIGKVVCTSAALKSLNVKASNIVIVWAAARGEPLELPAKLRDSERNQQRSLTIVDIQDRVFRRDASSKIQDRILRKWNIRRKIKYTSQEWLPLGVSVFASRLAAARKRLVVELTSSTLPVETQL